jgi:hypothetical protein
MSGPCPSAGAPDQQSGAALDESADRRARGSADDQVAFPARAGRRAVTSRQAGNTSACSQHLVADPDESAFQNVALPTEVGPAQPEQRRHPLVGCQP